MSTKQFRCLPVVAGLALALVTVLPAAQAKPQLDTNAYAEILITQRIEDPAPTVRFPTDDATPTGDDWDCQATDESSRVRVTCTPLVPNPSVRWVCPSPYIQASSFGPGTDTVVGTTRCGTVTTSCNPQRLTELVSGCTEHECGPAPMSFTCEADYSGITASDWTVLCRTYRSR